MYKKSLLLLLTLICINSSLAIPIPITNALLTVIPGIIITETSENQMASGGITGEITSSSSIKRDTIANLLVFYNVEVNKNETSYTHHSEGFNPIIFKESNGNIENQGCLHKIDNTEVIYLTNQYELLKAIEQNKALYCSKGRGALIYSHDGQPNSNLCKELEQQYRIFSQ